jgi:hypothetical protein
VSQFASPRLKASFPTALLERAHAVTIANVPFPPVLEIGLPEFEALANMPMSGITFDWMYCVRNDFDTEAIHFHELIHVPNGKCSESKHFSSYMRSESWSTAMRLVRLKP